MGKFNWKAQKERLKKNAETAGQQGSSKLKLPEGVKFFKVKKGKSMLDIIPYVVTDKNHLNEVPVGQPWPKKPIKVHYGVGPSEKSIICPTTVNQPCPICEEYAAMRKKYGADAKDKHDHLRPRLRELFNVIDTENEDDGIQIMEISYHCFGKKLDQELKESDEDFADYFFPEGGFTLGVRFTEETAGKTKFMAASRIDFKERDQDYKESIVEEAHCFDDMLIVLSYKDIERMFLDLPAEDEEKVPDPDEDAEKPSRPQRPQRPEKPAAEDEDDPKSTPARSRESSGRSRGEKPAAEDEAPARSRRRDPEPEPEPEAKPERSRRQRDPEPEPEPEAPRSRRQREPEPEPEARPERPKRPQREPEPEPEDEQGDSGGACPEADGKFGSTCDKFDACFDCSIWGDCHDLQEKNKKANRR